MGALSPLPSLRFSVYLPVPRPTPDTFSRYGYADAAALRQQDHAYGHDIYPQYPTSYVTPRVLSGLGSMSSKSAQEDMRKRAKKPTLRKVSAKATSSGKVVVPVSSFWSDWNRACASTLAPFAGVIDALPLSTSDKKKLRTRPLDALMDIFDPVEDMIGRVVDHVIAKKGAKQNYFGTMRDVRRVQAIDKRADVSTQNLLRRLRTIDAFIVLMWTQPVELAATMAAEGVSMVTKGVQDITKGARDATASVMRAFGLGDAGVVSAPTAAAAISTLAASLGVVLDVALVEAILTIVGMVVSALGGLAAAATLLTPEERASVATTFNTSGSGTVITPEALVARVPVVDPAARSDVKSDFPVVPVLLAVLVVGGVAAFR
jgi:hypothetical protein